jgi:hypothetical protein
LIVISAAGPHSVSANTNTFTYDGDNVAYANASLFIDPGSGIPSLAINGVKLSVVPEMIAADGSVPLREFSSLSVAGTGAGLDLKDNAVVFDFGAGTVQSFMSNGQIFSSATGGGAVGYLSLDANQTEVRLTLLGDTNLDGKVDATDLGNLAGSYGVASGAIWVQGDTNYDGKVDVTDLGNLASNYGANLGGGSSSAATPAASPVAATSEPATAPTMIAYSASAVTPRTVNSATPFSDVAWDRRDREAGLLLAAGLE